MDERHSKFIEFCETNSLSIAIDEGKVRPMRRSEEGRYECDNRVGFEVSASASPTLAAKAQEIGLFVKTIFYKEPYHPDSFVTLPVMDESQSIHDALVARGWLASEKFTITTWTNFQRVRYTRA